MIKKMRGHWDFVDSVRFNGVMFNADAVAAVSELEEAEIAAIVAAGVDIAALQADMGSYAGGHDLSTDVAALDAAMGSYSGGSLTDVATDVGALQTTVGDAQSGLVADVDALETAVGTYAGGADISTDLSGVVSTVGDAQSGLVADVDALETAVGTYAGDNDVATDLATLVSATPSGKVLLIPSPTERFLLVDDDSQYLYNNTPTGDVTQSLAGYTECTLTPGGSTAYTLSFGLPAAKTVPVFKVTYDKGTHAGTLQVTGGPTFSTYYVLTGSGVMYFGWDETTECYVDLGSESCTLAVDDTATCADLADVEFAMAAGESLTITLPTVKTAEVFVVDYKVDSAADGTVNIGDVTAVTGNASSATERLTFVWSELNSQYEQTDSINVPSGYGGVVHSGPADQSAEQTGVTLVLPTDAASLLRWVVVLVSTTQSVGTMIATHVECGAFAGIQEDVVSQTWYYFAGNDPLVAWFPQL